MMEVLFILVTTLSMAFCFRCRGGPFSFGSTFFARLLYWVLPNIVFGFVAAHFFFSHSLLLSLGIGFAQGFLAYVTLLEPFSHGPFVGFDLTTGEQSRADFDALTMVGAIRLFAMVLPLGLMGHVSVFAAPAFGSLTAYAYKWGWKYLHGKTFRFPIQKEGELFVQGGTEWGEVLCGGGYGLVMSSLVVLSYVLMFL